MQLITMQTYTIGTLVNFLETLAPPALQEGYDNSKLLVGNINLTCTGALTTLDCTEAVVDEAIAKGCNLIVVHHPILFSGLKSLTGKTYVERTLLKAIKNDVAIYAIHTNLDNVPNGVNKVIADKLGLQNLSILRPMTNKLLKLVVFVPQSHLVSLQDALFTAGAGHIGNYAECSFSTNGEGTFKGNDSSKPFVGEANQRHTEPEARLEVVLPAYKQSKVISAMQATHPYEEVAYDIIPLANAWHNAGAGMVGYLPNPVDEVSFLKNVKTTFNCGVIKHTALLNKPISKVAVCGGSGFFLLPDAIAAQADIYITADVKYHEFFDADSKIVLTDIGHYESEQFTKDLLFAELSNNFSTFAVHISSISTNPVNYLY